MAQESFDFDTIYDRRNTHSYKWDSKPMQEDSQLLPLFVADMDFQTAPAVKDALVKLAQTGIYGYTFVWPEYYEAVQQWMKIRHNMNIETDWIVPYPGIVPAIKHAVQLFTKPGDEILIFKPVYYPFDSSIKDNGRTLVEFVLTENDGKYSINFEELDTFLSMNKVKMIIFCSPHNPIGKVWSIEELQSLGTLAKKYNIFVVSDEIHMDFTWKNKPFISFLEACPELHSQTLVATAPSKTFNLAGLDASNLIIPDEKIRIDWKSSMDRDGINFPNMFGLYATEAAYLHGGEWLDALLKYIDQNYNFMKDWFEKKLPIVKFQKPEGLYLAWADFKGLGMNKEELEEFMLKKAHVWLDEGYIFGTGGEGFERFNCACPRPILEEALERILTAWNEKQKEDKM